MTFNCRKSSLEMMWLFEFDSLESLIADGLETLYYYVQHDLQIHIIPAGTGNYIKQVATGYLPRRLAFFMVSEKAYNGATMLSPFKYGHFNINFIQLHVAGDRSYPAEPLTPDFEQDNFVETYLSLYENMRNSLGGDGLPFGTQEFKNGMFMWAMDLTKDYSSGAAHWSLTGSGVATLQLRFKTPLKENVILVCVHEIERIAELDGQGRVSIRDAPLH